MCLPITYIKQKWRKILWWNPNLAKALIQIKWDTKKVKFHHQSSRCTLTCRSCQRGRRVQDGPQGCLHLPWWQQLPSRVRNNNRHASLILWKKGEKGKENVLHRAQKETQLHPLLTSLKTNNWSNKAFFWSIPDFQDSLMRQGQSLTHFSDEENESRIIKEICSKVRFVLTSDKDDSKHSKTVKANVLNY